MTPLERLLAEGIPDGTFGGARESAVTPRRRTQGEPALDRPPDPDAAEHRRALLAALDECPNGKPRRHLRPVPDPFNRPRRAA